MKTTTLLVSALALAFTFGTAMAQTDTKRAKKKTSLFEPVLEAGHRQGADRQGAQGILHQVHQVRGGQKADQGQGLQGQDRQGQGSLRFILRKPTSGRLDRGARCHLRKAQGPPNR